MMTKIELEKENAQLRRRVAQLEKQLARQKSGAATLELKHTRARQVDQEVVQTSQDRFLELAGFMDEVFWVYDFGTRHITYINPAYERVWGRTVASLHQDPNTFLNSIHPDDRAQVDQATIRQMQGERSTAEYRIIRPDGTMRWIWGRGFPVIVEGKCQRIIGIASDITAQKQAEANLLAHQENMHALLENTDASIWSIDTQYRMIVGNRLYHRNVNASIGRKLQPGENVLALDLPQAAISEWRGYYDRALRGETFYIETTTRFAEHPQTIEYHFNPIMTDAGQVAGVTVLGRNITERKHAEAQHAKLIERLELATRSAHMGIWDWDIQNNVLVWDERMYELYGRRHDEFGGAYEAWLKGVHPEDRAASDEVSARARAGEIEYDTEFRVVWPDGSIHWLKANGEVFRDEHGAPTRMIGVNYDITERKHAEQALRESEARYRLIADNSSDVIWVLDPIAGKFTYVSPSVQQLRGYTPEEVMAQPVNEALTPESLKIVSTGLTEQLPLFIAQGSGTRSLVTEVDQPRKDGSIVNTEVTTTYVFNEQGQVEIIGVSRDITERKCAERQVQETLIKLEKLIEILPVGISVLDHENRVVKQNAALEKILGISAEGLARGDYRLRHYIRPDGTPMPGNEFASARVRQGEASVSNVETGIIKEDGTVIWTSVSAIAFPLSDWSQVIVTVDVTERKRAEEDLRKSEARFRGTLDTMQEGVLLIGWNWHYLFINKSAEIQGRRPTEELLGKTVIECWPGIEANDFFRLEQKVMQDRLPRQIEGPFTFPDGGIHWFNWNIQPAPEGLLIVTQDITERKLAEEKLQDTLQELQRANKELEQFAYVASHDLQEPLRAVAGMVQLLQKRYEGQLDAQADEYIHHAVDAATRMRELINDLLAFSRVGTRAKPLASTDMNAVLDWATRNLHVTIEENHAIITHEDLPTVMGDATQLGQLVQNLIGNAVKFHSDQPPHIHISVQTLPDVWRFAVRDNGIGIKPEYFERIFIVFQRLHTRRAYPGTGIGLALCKKIVERHGGKIWVESQFGQGSTFYFTLPKS